MDTNEDKNPDENEENLESVQPQDVYKDGEYYPAGKLPEIYRIQGESDEVGSWDDLVEKAPHSGYIRPDEVGDRKLHIMSGMDKLVMYVTNKIQNAFIYTKFRTDSSRFQAEFVAIAVVAGKTYTSTYITPGYAIGMTDEDVEREGALVLDGLVVSLGQRAFGQKTQHIPDGAFMSFEYTREW